MATSSSSYPETPPSEIYPGLSMETVFPDEQTTWLVFHGEADLATRDSLQEQLASVARLERTGFVHLHLADLTFADSRAVRDLSDFATDARERGTTVVSCDPTPLLRRMAGILGLAIALGVA